MPRFSGYKRSKAKVYSYGKTFRTRSGKLGRYVYKFGKRIAFEGVRRGATRYVANRTYDKMSRRRR